jgi:hypothetical protein
MPGFVLGTLVVAVHESSRKVMKIVAGFCQTGPGVER